MNRRLPTQERSAAEAQRHRHDLLRILGASTALAAGLAFVGYAASGGTTESPTKRAAVAEALYNDRVHHIKIAYDQEERLRGAREADGRTDTTITPHAFYLKTSTGVELISGKPGSHINFGNLEESQWPELVIDPVDSMPSGDKVGYAYLTQKGFDTPTHKPLPDIGQSYR